MNLQPRALPRVSSPLPVALALSAGLHLLWCWPVPPPPARAAQPAVRVSFVRVAPAAEPAPAPRVVASHPAPGARPERAATVASARPPSARTTSASSGGPAPSDGALRALRFALARQVPAEAAAFAGPAVSITLEVQLLARRVVGVDIVRSSGDDALDRRVLAVFKAAARDAVIPDTLPPHGFSVELEVEGGKPERSNDETPLAPG